MVNTVGNGKYGKKRFIIFFILIVMTMCRINGLQDTRKYKISKQSAAQDHC